MSLYFGNILYLVRVFTTSIFQVNSYFDSIVHGDNLLIKTVQGNL